MDDYLSKPVRPKLLEKMLVKWTIQGQARLNTPADQSPSELSAAQASRPTQTKSQERPGPSTLVHNHGTQDDLRRSSTDSLGARLDTSSESIQLEYEPTADTQGATWQTEERDKTMSLHDDKILSAAAHSYTHTPKQDHHFEDDERHAGTKGPSHALTRENMDKFANEQGKRGGLDGVIDTSDASSMINGAASGLRSKTAHAGGAHSLAPSSTTSVRPSLNMSHRKDSEATVRQRSYKT